MRGVRDVIVESYSSIGSDAIDTHLLVPGYEIKEGSTMI